MRGEGDCYEAAAKLLYAHRSCPGIVLAHGTVTGQGPIAGIRYGHAWIEVGDVVLDPSNGRFVCARKSAYYAAGEIREPVARYDFEAAARQMLETRHYGPWETCPILTPPAGAKRSHTADKRGFSGVSTPSLQPIPSTARKMVKKRMDSVRNQREAKGVIMKTKSTKVEVTTKLYRKLHGEEPHGKAPSSWGERLWWFCPAWQIERKVLILDKAGIRGTFTEAKAEARKFFAARGTKRVALVPPYWDVVNRGKGNELLFLSPEDYVARKARRQAKRK